MVQQQSRRKDDPNMALSARLMSPKGRVKRVNRAQSMETETGDIAWGMLRLGNNTEQGMT